VVEQCSPPREVWVENIHNEDDAALVAAVVHIMQREIVPHQVLRLHSPQRSPVSELGCGHSNSIRMSAHTSACCSMLDGAVGACRGRAPRAPAARVRVTGYGYRVEAVHLALLPCVDRPVVLCQGESHEASLRVPGGAFLDGHVQRGKRRVALVQMLVLCGHRPMLVAMRGDFNPEMIPDVARVAGRTIAHARVRSRGHTAGCHAYGFLNHGSRGLCACSREADSQSSTGGSKQ
jgi:hypothetical protein